MVTIIKNQLLKHLSRFTKNLSPEQISVSALRGQGSLSSLQLDETVLTELLELPPWIRLASATCGKATFRVHWTKLKNMPIELNLEDVQIIIETCSEPRDGSTSPSPAPSPVIPPARYSFIHKVIDGISITVNTVKIQFTTPVFVATVQMTRISVESRTPQWQSGDLRLTRLKDPKGSQILIFKEISWQSARIEARAVREGGGLPPLRLLTNQAHCRITIKKRLSDCFVVGSRIVLILEEALWVLTDRQLGAALAFADSLAGLANSASAQVTRNKAQRKLETLPEYLAQVSQSQGRTPSNPGRPGRPTDPLIKLFAHNDVIETSYHFLSQKIDLHLCDDPGLGRSSHPSLAAGAALQVTLQKLQFDYYPYHLATGDRNKWPGYRESSGPHTQWLQQALTTFRGSLLSLFDTRTQKTSESDGVFDSMPESVPQVPSSPLYSNLSPANSGNSIRHELVNQLAKLMTTCVILRLDDFTLYKVTTGERKEVPKSFICGDRERFSVPEEVRALHVEFTHFYYPGDMRFPVPSPKLFLQVNPVKITFDLTSCLWLNSFILNLLSCIKYTQASNMDGDNDLMFIDINVEAIMPRIVVDGGREHPGQRDRPRSLQIQVSRATITNSHGSAGGGGELTACLTSYSASSLLQPYCCTDTMLKHAAGEEKGSYCKNKENTRALWGGPRKVWCVKLDPVWADFCGARASPHKPTPFLDAVPFTLWVYLNMNDDDDINKLSINPSNVSRNKDFDGNHVDPGIKIDEKTAKQDIKRELKIDDEADMQIVAHCSQLVSIQLNHYQFLLILRLAERLTELASFLALDAARVLGPNSVAKSRVIGCIIPQVEITLVLPSCCPGKESSRDLDSVLPDSSSLLDLQQNTGSGTLCNQPHGNGSSNILSQNSLERHNTLTPQSYIPSNNTAAQNQIIANMSEPCIESDVCIANQEVGDIPTQVLKDGLSNISNMNASISMSVRRGFTSFISSIDAALKPSEQNLNHAASGGPSPSNITSSNDQWDSLSVASSDSERYVMVQLAGDQDTDAGYRLWDGTNERPIDTNVEVAAEVLEHSSSPSERSIASSCRRRDLVSMSTFKVKHVEFLQISRGFYSQILLNIIDLSVEECSSIPWDELQNKFSTRTRGWSDNTVNNIGANFTNETPKMSIDLIHYPHCSIFVPYNLGETVTLESVMESFSDYLSAEAKNLNLTINMSTAMGLSDLIEDEIITTPIPLEVLLENISLKLIEDRPVNTISSPGTIPLQLCLSGLKFYRGKDGVLHLEPKCDIIAPKTDNSRNDAGQIQLLLQENENLKRRLNALERLALESDSLRRSKEEIDVLKSLLMSAQDQAAGLLDEKSTLLNTVRDLQERASGVEMRGTGSVWARHNKR